MSGAIDFIDLKTQYAALKNSIARRMQRVLDHGQYIMGPEVAELEGRLAQFTGAKHCVTVASGTEALLIALIALDLQPGDEVVTTPFTFAATAEMIVLLGGVPVFADIEADTCNIDASKIEALITPRTRAIMPVYLAGLPVDMDHLYRIAAMHGLRVVEDAAQAFGSSWNGQRIGARGDLVSFSFHANKNITAAEGGALVLAHENEASRSELLRLQGVRRFGEDGMDVEFIGGKFNLTDLAARIALGQLPRLDEFTQKRRRLAKRYFRAFDRSLGCELPPADFENSNWHMFQIVLPLERLAITRGDFIARMREEGFGIGVHYPCVHLFSLYRSLGWQDGQFPHAERIGRAIATLPLFPGMSEGDVERVCAAVQKVISGGTRS